jgi:hypothetical protein
LSKFLMCLALALFVAGCVPIGARVSNMYVEGQAAPPH